MSFQAMAWAVQQDLPMREKMVLVMLANYASNERGDCYPSINALSKDCGAGKDTIIRAIKTLEEGGYLSINRRQQEGVNLPNTYTLNMQGVVANSDYGSRSQQGGVVAESDSNLLLEPITSSLRSEVKARAPEKASAQSELMKVLDQDHAKAVIDHRKALKKPLTPHAAKLLAAQFSKCPDPNAAADAMIAHGWQGFDPQWLQNRQQAAKQRASPASRKLTHTDIWADALREEGLLPNEPDSHSTDILDAGYGNRHQESNVHPLRIASAGRY